MAFSKVFIFTSLAVQTINAFAIEKSYAAAENQCRETYTKATKVSTYKGADQSFNGSAAQGPDGTIVIGSMGGKVYCFNADGTLKNGSSFANTAGLTLSGVIQSKPVVAKDGLFAVGTTAGKVHYFNSSCKSESYSIALSDINAPSDKAIDNWLFQSSSGNLYAPTRGGYMAVVPNNSSAPKYLEIDKIGRAQTKIISGYTELSDNTVVASSYDGNLYCTKLTDDQFIKSKTIKIGSPIVSVPVQLSDGSIGVTTKTSGTSGSVKIVNTEGKILSSVDTDGFAQGGLVYNEKNETYVVATSTGYIYILDKNGKQLSKTKTSAVVAGAPAITPDGMIVLAGGSDRKIHFLSPDGVEVTESTLETTGDAWGTPLVTSDGKVVIADMLKGAGVNGGNVYFIDPPKSNGWKTPDGKQCDPNTIIGALNNNLSNGDVTVSNASIKNGTSTNTGANSGAGSGNHQVAK